MRRLPPPLTKPGKYGTLFRYVVTYGDRDPGEPQRRWSCWAYSAEHAEEQFSCLDEDYTIYFIELRREEARV